MAIHRAALLALLLGALPLFRASAQFSTPYDPDFAPEPSAPNAESAAPAPEAPPPLVSNSTQTASPGAIILSVPGNFLLLDRPDPSHVLESAESAPAGPPPAPPFEDFETQVQAPHFDAQQWERMRSNAEQGAPPPSPEFEPPPFLETSGPVTAVAVSSPTPSLPPPEVEAAAYGTSLSVTGRKVIGFNYSEKRFLNPQTTTGRAQVTDQFGITQQMQLRMQGQMGPRVGVNIDYDDTKPDKQDISVVYKGNPDEVVQNASFGDIDLSLPATEFVSYNKQVFGIRADLKYKGFNATFIGSRTKGTTKTKEFVGNTQFVATDIPDSSYIRHQYYDLTFNNSARLPLLTNSEHVFLAQQAPIGTLPATAQTFTADDLAVPSSTYTGTFVPLIAGQDYTIDYVHGVLTLRSAALPQYVIAVDFVDATGHHITTETSTSFTGGTGLYKLIKTNADLAINGNPTLAAEELGYDRELKTEYSIGQVQIVRDNGQGNFVLQVIDPQTRNLVGPSLNPVQEYPQTITVDFENGLFRLNEPFGISASSSTPDPQLYSPTPITKHLIHVEYHFRLKTFLLEPNLVLQSDIITVDGVKLVRNVDYFIDYTSGFVTFFNPNRIGPTSVVDVTYDVAPAGGGPTSDSILGGHMGYDFSKNAGIGTTLLYESGTKATTAPQITDIARSLMVYDLDAHWKDVPLIGKLKGSFSGEVAQSHLNPDLNGNALIDNMEGVLQQDSANMLASGWKIASNPGGVPSDPTAVTWANENTLTLDITPNAQASPTASQVTLDMDYNFSNNETNNEVSIVYPFSTTGLDFSKRTILQVVMKGDMSNNLINFRLGGINEDADGTGGMTLNCANGQTILNAPKTEDLQCTGILQPGEDIGWLYSPVGKNSTRYGANDGVIDTEGLSGDFILHPDDGLGDNYGYNATAGSTNNQLFDATTGSTRTAVNFGGPMWHTFQIPLNISTTTAVNWTAIKQIRISIQHAPGGANSGVISFAQVSVIGNTWLPGEAGDPSTGSGAVANEALAVSAINNVSNPGYVPIYNAGGVAESVFNQLYGSVSNLQQQNNAQNQTLSEQSLQLTWSNLIQGTTVYTERIFTKPIDVSQHKQFSFLLYGNADSNNVDTSGKQVFFLRVGSDQNFWEMDVPITFMGWQEFTANQIDTNGSQIPSTWAVGQGTPGTVIVSSGTPNLQQIAEIVTGVYARGSPKPQGTAYLDEIFVSQPFDRTGNAYKAQADFNLPGWTTFGFKTRYMDHNFMTPTSVVSNQDNEQDTSYLNWTRWTFMPWNMTLSRTVTNTPNAAATGNLSNLVNLLQEGRVVAWNGTITGNLAYKDYPRLTLGYVKAKTEYDLLSRVDDVNTYNIATTYSPKSNKPWVPKSLNLNYSYSQYSVVYNSQAAQLTPGNYGTDDFTNTYGARLSFIPWKGSAFNPTYTSTVVTEKRDDMTSGVDIISRYPKSASQTMGFTSNFKLNKWLNPAVNYTVGTIENNNLSSTTYIVGNSTYVYNPGDLKTINQSDNGSITLPFNAVDLFPKTRLFHSLNVANSYQMQDGAVWDNVESGIDSRMLLSVRQAIHPQAAAAQLVNETLRDTFNSTQRWAPFEVYGLLGRIAAFKTLSISNNFVESIQRTDVTGTYTKTITTTLPDLVASMGQLEKLLWTERWMSNGQINIRYSAHDTVTVGQTDTQDDQFGTDFRTILWKTFDSTISFNRRSSQTVNLALDQPTSGSFHEDGTLQTTFDVGKYRMTPKVTYVHDTASTGGAATQDDTTITPSLLVRADLALPKGLMLPFMSKPLFFTNRIIWTNTVSLAFLSSPVTEEDNSTTLNLNTSADYELAKNLRMTLNASIARLWHKYIAQEDYISYSFGTTFTFQF